MFLNKKDITFVWWFLLVFKKVSWEFERPVPNPPSTNRITNKISPNPCIKPTSRDPLSKDMLHCVHQGVAPLAIASLIADLFEDLDGSLTIAGLDAALASQAWPHLLEALQTNDTDRARKRAYCAYRNSGALFLPVDVANDMCYWGRTFYSSIKIWEWKLLCGTRTKECTKWCQNFTVSSICVWMFRSLEETRDMTIFTWMKISCNIYLGLQAEPTPIRWTRWCCTDTVLWLSSACDQKNWCPRLNPDHPQARWHETHRWNQLDWSILQNIGGFSFSPVSFWDNIVLQNI